MSSRDFASWPVTRGMFASKILAAHPRVLDISAHRNLTPHQLCAEGKVGTLRELLYQYDPESIVMLLDDESLLPIHHACEHGHTEIITMLLEFFPEEQIASSPSPLHVACTHSMEAAQVLLEYDVELQIMQQDEEGNIPLHIAADGQPDIVQLLLQYYPEWQVVQENLCRELPLHRACRERSGSVGFLLQHEPLSQVLHRDESDRIPLHWVCWCQDKEERTEDARLLLEFVPAQQVLSKCTEDNSIPLHYAMFDRCSYKGGVLQVRGRAEKFLDLDNSELVEALLVHEPEKQVCQRDNHWYPIHEAVELSRLNTLRVLLQFLPDVQVLLRKPETGEIALHWVAERGLILLARELLKHLPEQQLLTEDDSRSLPIHKACYLDYCPDSVSTVKLLLQYIPREQTLRQDGKYKQNPVHFVIASQGELVDQMLEHAKEAIYQEDQNGDCPLEAKLKCPRGVAAVLKRDPDLLFRDKVDWREWMKPTKNREELVGLFANGHLHEQHLPFVVKDEGERAAFIKEMDLMCPWRRKKSARNVQPHECEEFD